uniref:Uncharacterized protein n=1 Tax=Anguilla anguilla TaxID=7936 RepID=A0A0E9UZY2_ANGAN
MRHQCHESSKTGKRFPRKTCNRKLHHFPATLQAYLLLTHLNMDPSASSYSISVEPNCSQDT